MIDRSESDLIAQEQKNRSGGTAGVSSGGAVHGGDRVTRRKRAPAANQSVRNEPVSGHPATATPPVRTKQ